MSVDDGGGDHPGIVRLVVVDDSADLRLMFSMIFGLDPRFSLVGEAGDGVEALAVIEATEPDIVVLDVEMPTMNGLEVLDELRGWDQPPAVVALSGVSDQVAGEQALSRGARAYFTKSIEPNELADRIYATHLDAAGSVPSTLGHGRPPAPSIDDEAERLDAVRRTGLIDSGDDDDFDTITELVAAACDVPIALVTLIDEDRQWFKSRQGLDTLETPRDDAFCAHAITEPERIFVIEDATADHRFADNPLVTGPPHIRFYAGAPVCAPNGQPVGTLCVIDTEPRRLDERTGHLLRRAARQVEALVASRIERDEAVDEQERLESRHEALERQVDERTRFLAVAQHKLKTPLAVIAGWSNALHHWDRLGETERRGGLDAISRASVELQAQIDDLLDEARTQLFEQSRRIERIGLASFVEAQVADQRFDPTRHPVHVMIPADVHVSADADALRHIIAHLLDNAVKYSPDGGAIEVTADVSGDHVCLTVADEGIGLPADVDVFAPFQRGHGAERIARGTGLGLHIVRSLSQTMDGDARAHDGPSGAVIEVTLPRA